ncbi:hypothetical protein L1887_61753 [Cichorium endivia]|nr:hypothetical protein L1887_61753 [Cichorium endivia]
MRMHHVVDVRPVKQVLVVANLELGLARAQHVEEAWQRLPVADAKDASGTQCHRLELARLHRVGLENERLRLGLGVVVGVERLLGVCKTFVDVDEAAAVVHHAGARGEDELGDGELGLLSHGNDVVDLLDGLASRMQVKHGDVLLAALAQRKRNARAEEARAADDKVRLARGRRRRHGCILGKWWWWWEIKKRQRQGPPRRLPTLGWIDGPSCRNVAAEVLPLLLHGPPPPDEIVHWSAGRRRAVGCDGFADNAHCGRRRTDRWSGANPCSHMAMLLEHLRGASPRQSQSQSRSPSPSQPPPAHPASSDTPTLPLPVPRPGPRRRPPTVVSANSHHLGLADAPFPLNLVPKPRAHPTTPCPPLKISRRRRLR